MCRTLKVTHKCHFCWAVMGGYTSVVHKCPQRILLPVRGADGLMGTRPYCPVARVDRLEGFLPYCDECRHDLDEGFLARPGYMSFNR
ncbi:hypothetical protein CcaCcLH18_08451 [Colletotrichum camelliae]|nr:hypothetical protein CcaCcLH18_08451 [Colletotrichum camelliae]